jgi:hypothetical protein
MAVLGLTELTGRLDSEPVLDHVAALVEAAAWLAQRDPHETAPRAGVGPLIEPDTGPEPAIEPTPATGASA